MILYFADRAGFNILGAATTGLQDGYRIISDTLTETLENGTATFECEISFEAYQRIDTERVTELGNYILRYDQDSKRQDFFTIMEQEIKTDSRTVRVYSEAVGMDLLNEVVDQYAATKAESIEFYVRKFVGDSGFVIGINEASTLTRKLEWDGEDTILARLGSVATQFGCEIGYSFEIKNLKVTKRYVDIYKKRGNATDVRLRMGKEVGDITINKNANEISTAIKAVGADDITLKGYAYDDGDMYVSTNGVLHSRSALNRWKRWDSGTGDIVTTYQSEAKTKASLLREAKAQLAKDAEPVVTYDVAIIDWNVDISVGDTLYIVDDNAELYLQARIQQLETKTISKERQATLGDFVLLDDGMSNKLNWLSSSISLINSQIGNIGSTYAIKVESTAGSMFKGTAINTTLVAHVYGSNKELTEDEINALGVINWYNTAGVLIRGNAKTLEVSTASESISYIVKLEKEEEE